MVNKIDCGPYTLNYDQKTIIMGILNVNPDSFSDGGKYNEMDRAVKHAVQMVEDGADIIDIGGESTRPGYTEISIEEELERVIPIIERLANEVNVPLSIDTYKGEVARQSLQAGAHIINDIWGAKRDPSMAEVAAEYQAPIILMHNRDNLSYTSFLEDVVSDLQESIDMVKGAGVSAEKIILDPGIGFAKDLKGNLDMMRGLDKLVEMGYPVLLGTSRKSLIGHVLNLPVSERLEGTGATICYGIQKGCQLIRVHDVKEMTRMARMMDALMGKGEYSG
ncbi:dihydropteroate synthase [Niallia circulans]|uniref:dihydropteroate synthase n=1 Tax=Niallia TaxID=2837506 RepID=UPI00077CCD7B|nr:dihydropteroate synthase [Niallia circulans]MDR4318940.1 dihydropteroate synthase [Niallia circulans]MED3839702.1 dihydropteroate synthase [Niallia circulans]MED4245494.1 dihydropteroate synthase [Niallia circulans]MED4250423.1 dihydropteroate synthase [Niallia circulans]PAD23312.1 dihydropteroate synthase [Niallia circulans]